MENPQDFFRFSREAWRFLKDNGYPVEERCFYNHVGKMEKDSQGRLLKEAVLAYAEKTWPKNKPTGSYDNLINLKIAREIFFYTEAAKTLVFIRRALRLLISEGKNI